MEQTGELVGGLPCGICNVRQDETFSIRYGNEFFYAMCGYTQQQALAAGFTHMQFIVLPIDWKRLQRAVRESLESGRSSFELEYRCTHRSGAVLWMLARCKRDPKNPDCISGIVLDITQRKRLTERDALTGLYNRRMLLDRIEERLGKSGPNDCHGLIMLDVDKFKQLNDTYGHCFGDRVLRDIAAKLGTELRPDDLCGRMGGDEFGVFLGDTKRERDLEPRLTALTLALEHTYPEGAGVSVSMGLAAYPRDGTDFETLYHKADVALYRGKKQHGAHYAVYNREIDAYKRSKHKL